MFKPSAYMLAALAMVSMLVTTVDVQAGNADQRRIHKHQTHKKIEKRRNFSLRDVNLDKRYNGAQRLANGRKRFNTSTLSFRLDGDRWRHHARNHFNDDHRHRGRVRVNTSNVVLINIVGDRGYRLPVRPSLSANTYSGSVDVYSVPGVGTYSYGDSVYNGDGLETTASAVASSVRIIDVGSLKPNGSCDMQAGVCVIRP